MRVVSAVFRIVIGVVFGAGCFFALSPALAALFNGSSGGSAAPLALLALVLCGALVGLFSPSIRRAFGWSFLALSLCIVALPLSTMLLAGRVAADVTSAAATSERSATLVGAGLAGGLMTGAAALVGFFLGAIFLVIALVLLLGGRRQVILVDRATGREVAADSYDEPQQLRGRPSPRIDPPPLR